MDNIRGTICGALFPQKQLLFDVSVICRPKTNRDQAMTRTSVRQSERGNYRGFARLGFATIVLGFGGLLGWAASAPLDSAAVAVGQVEVETAVKPVQHLEGGLISEILVKETDKVRQGDVLFRLQSTQAKAKLEALQVQIDAQYGRRARLSAEQRGSSAITFPNDLLDRGNDHRVAGITANQRQQFQHRMRLVRERERILRSRLAETQSMRTAKQGRERALVAELASLSDEIKRLKPLVARGLYPRNKLAQSVRKRERLTGDLDYVRGEIERQSRAAEGARIQIAHVRQQHQEELARQLSETNTKIAALQADLSVARDQMARIVVRAPRDGVIQNIQVTTVGEVVKPGQLIAEIVPVTDKLVVGAKLAPIDIDSIRSGLKAELRVRAFSASRIPSIRGKVVKVSADTMIDDVSREAYYKVSIEIDRSTVAEDLARRMVPGMPVDVIISTGERTALQYLFDPLLNAFAMSMREK